MSVLFERVSKIFPAKGREIVALKDVDLQVDEGEFFVLLGPSGCGKSTVLNLTAGLEKPSEGRILFGKNVVADAANGYSMPPGERNVAMVFQNYALYPHMSVRGNIAFPLQVAGRPRDEIERSVRDTAGLLGIGDLLDRRPGELSGGQRQRVAMARALVRKPRIFLLDEPLSNLDAQLRLTTRTELKRLQRELGVTTLYVTHDQTEAMSLGQRIALLREGRIQQVGTPDELYERPETPFVGAFIGSPPMNLIPGHKEGRLIETLGTRFEAPEGRAERVPDGPVLVGVRPEHLLADSAEDMPTIQGDVSAVEPLGRDVIVHVEIKEEAILWLAGEHTPERGETVKLGFSPQKAHLFGKE